jgi:hypothetical protein
MHERRLSLMLTPERLPRGVLPTQTPPDCQTPPAHYQPLVPSFRDPQLRDFWSDTGIAALNLLQSAVCSMNPYMK